MYCANCRMITGQEPECPFCGSRKIREPAPEDICFLAEMPPIQAGMLKDVLEQENIPVLSSSTLGAAMAMRAGAIFERVKLFVRYEHLYRAAELAGELFGPSQEDSE